MDLTARLDRTVDDAIASNRIVGSVTLVARKGELVYARAAGHFDREAGLPMRRDAIFRLASVTKPIVAATALAMIERNLIGLNDPVADYLPYFKTRLADGRDARPSVRHLLTHTSGLISDYAADPLINTGLPDTDFSFEENFSRVARLPLSFEPGAAWQYGISIDVLGAVVAAVHGATLGEAVQHYVTGPLGMTDTGFVVGDRSRLAVPYADGAPGLRRMGDPETVLEPDGGTTSFSPARCFNPKAFQSGGAGMLGSADDLLKFFDTLRVGGGPILRPETVEMATMNQIGELPREAKDAGQRFGFLGAVLDDPAAANSPQARGSFRWGGIYGHDWSVDPENGFTIVSMTNTAVEGCIGLYPKQVRDAVYGRG